MAEDGAYAEAERTHPQDWQAQAAAVSRFTEAKKTSLATDLKLTPEELSNISAEGIERNWAMPKPRKK
jgi:hypothetical protein